MEHGTADGRESRRRPPPTNGYRREGATGVTSGSPEAPAHGFAQSQLAGLSAIIRLADTPATANQRSAVALSPPPAGPPPSLPGWAEVPLDGVELAATAPELVLPPPSVVTTDAPGQGTKSPHHERKHSLRGQSLTQIPGLPLMIILTIQIVLSARLVRSNTAFSDEALYLWAGRLEWSHWLHHTAIPPFQVYFSGAPVVYPPLGALANAVGGLAGARILSMCFMLGATVLLHGFTKRIFDPRSANFAAALFAGLGSAQFLGAFATYDAMAIFMLALATWLGLRAAGCKQAGQRAAMIILAAAVLVTADAAKYAAALFDPVVLITIACLHWHALGRRAGALAGLLATIGTGTGIAVALALGGPSYVAGVTSTTLSRATSDWPAFGILYASAGWVGIVLLLAIFGAMATTYASQSASAKALVWTLVAAGLLAPAEQARIHVFTSLFKHVAFGSWFAAPVAGYALTAFIRAVPMGKSIRALKIAVTVMVLSGIFGVLLAADHFGNWADINPVIPTLAATLRAHPGPLLVDSTAPFDYYLTGAEPWQEITSIPRFSAQAEAQVVRQRQYAVILLSYAGGGGDCGNADPTLKRAQATCSHSVDIRILSDILGYGGYRLVARIPYRTTAFQSAYLVWVREGSR
jgi:hypothetical protein